MNTRYKLGSFILSALMLMSSCQKEENVNASLETQPFSVNFTLGGSAGIVGSGVASRTTPVHSDEEKAVKSLWAIAFEDIDRNAGTHSGSYPVDDEDKFYRAIKIEIPAEEESVESLSFDFLLDKEGYFQVCFIANTDDNLDEFFTGLTSSKTVSDFKNHITTGKACDDKTGGLLMTSAFYPVESSWTTPFQIDQVILTRAMARIDVKNNIEGMNINQIDFINRATTTKLYQGSTTSYETDITLENKLYEGLTINGKGSTYSEKIYTYEQLANSDQSDKLPKLKIYYTTEAEPETQLSHTIDLVYNNDGKSEAVGLKRNYLYTVTLTRKASAITANLEVLDWNKGDEVGVTPGEIGGGTTVVDNTGNGIATNPGNAGSIDVFE